MERRLAAILAADVVEYSRLMSADEAGTLAALRDLRAGVFGPLVAEHGGSIVKSMGDGWLVAFDTARQAVTCAIRLQDGLVGHVLRLRIGIHIGDVTHEAEDVFGGGVNIAARLEALAAPGAVAISDAVRSSLDGTLRPVFADLGPQTLKNIAEPLRVWTRHPAAHASPDVAASVAVSGTVAQADTTSAPGRAAAPAGRIRPSIAVLPFTNLSADPDQAFLAEGLVEDVIAALSRFSSLLVISRNSTTALKNRAMDVREIARALDVAYVVEGSVRRAGDRLRVAVQLVDGATGVHLRAERFDRTMADLFELQDDLTLAIVAAVAPEVTAQEIARVRNVPTTNLTAWELYQRAMGQFYRYTPDCIAEARALAQRAVEADPTMAAPLALLSRIASSEYLNGGSPDPEGAIRAALDWGERAVATDQRSEEAHNALGFALALSDRVEEGIGAMRRGLQLNPNNGGLRLHLAFALMVPGQERAEEALEQVALARRLSPADPFDWTLCIGAMVGCLQLGRFEEAAKHIATYRDAPQVDWKYMLCAALCDVLLGMDDRAEAAIRVVRDRATQGQGTLAAARNGIPAAFALPRLEHAYRRLTALGLPEC